jgi:hypothetical protein
LVRPGTAGLVTGEETSRRSARCFGCIATAFEALRERDHEDALPVQCDRATVENPRYAS